MTFTAPTPLANVPVGAEGRVVALDLAGDVAAWLEAMGVGPGVTLRVLRRAPFGGPLHVRASSGGEFALDRDLAASIRVASVEVSLEAAEAAQ